MGKAVRVEQGGGLLLMFFVCVGFSLSEAVNDTLINLQKLRRRCVNPEVCCQLEQASPEFYKCCVDHGCCPQNCGDVPTIRGKIDCDGAWSCCRFWSQPRELEKCCTSYGCCPLCEEISRGCCYNGRMYMWGDVVDQFPDLCFMLVCAAQVSTVRPFLNAVIVPVMMQSFACKEREKSNNCAKCSCVDATGLVQTESVPWYSDECHKCSCRAGKVVCEKQDVPCPLQPHSSCVAVPGPCCPAWNCSVGCTDSHGGYHQLGEEWTMEDPCIIFTCTKGLIEEKLVNCKLMAPPYPGCSEYTPRGECCLKWNCSGCVDENGKLHTLYKVWKSDSCTTNYCTRSGIQTTRHTCELGPAPHPSCLKIITPEECCPKWNCSGCTDPAGGYYELGQEWTKSDPCVVLKCTEGVINENSINCDKLALPRPGCSEYTPVGECCPKWNCSGCIDGNGKLHPLYEMWKTDACTTNYCTGTGIQTTQETCDLEPAPHPNCQKIVPPRECCPEWICRGCRDTTGNFHDLGDKWSIGDPCVVLLCTEKEIVTERVKCKETLPPNADCTLYKPLGDCCSKWNCSGCVDPSGNYHPLYQLWKTDNCTTSICTRDGIKASKENCSAKPAPHPSCQSVTSAGDCCPQWKCRGCLDDNGKYFEFGQERPTSNPCILSVCSERGFVAQTVTCKETRPSHPDCYEYIPFLSCCPQWNCRGCWEENGSFHDLGQEWSTADPCVINVCTDRGIKRENVQCRETKPPRPGCIEYKSLGECCSEWNCSGCTDNNGTNHPLYKVWKSDPCTTHKCTMNGINSTKEKCKKAPAPHPSCQLYIPPRECCPQWRCRGCIDRNAKFHGLGEKINTDDPCLVSVCTELGITMEHVYCSDTIPPNTGCYKYQPIGECCSKWNCSGCVDSSGNVHPLYQVWKTDPCTTHVCLKDGIKTAKENCSLGPAPDKSCQTFTPPGDCCPEWKCSECEDEFGNVHPLHKVWKTDPCTTHSCRSDGIETAKEICSLGPAPGTSCQTFTPPGECCPEWKCRGCFDDGNFRELGRHWKTGPCTVMVCTERGIVEEHLDCGHSQQPHPGCYKHTPLGECCPKWNCSVCVDDDGNFHPLYQTWKTDPCTTHTCTNNGIQSTRQICNLEPAPDHNCVKDVGTGDCCPVWNCSGCVDLSGQYHELHQRWEAGDCFSHECTSEGILTSVTECIPKPHPNCVELKPPTKCCPIWRCGGCHDELGMYHPLSSEWKTGPCKTSLCTNDGIRVTEVFCGRTVRPYSNCIEYTPDGECCSKWNCSCVDGHGKPHGEGESWKDPEDPCQYCSCTGGKVTCGMLDCDSPPPWPCDPPKLPGQCCPNTCAPPVINACRDKEGNNRREGESWTDSEDPCLSCTCVKGKGRCVKVQCAAAPDWPCDPPKLPGQCCPHYCPRPMNTRTTSAVELDSCVDNYGTRHPLGEVWVDQSNSCLQYWCGRLGFIQSFKGC